MIVGPYHFTPEQVSHFNCNDCGINVIERGDFCMLQHEIWDDQFGLGLYDNLCLACIETRLGRPLTEHDCICFPRVFGYPTSPALAERFGFAKHLGFTKKPNKKRKV
jgi:hypothetical protein